MTFSGNTILIEGFGDFIKNLGKKDSMLRKRWQRMFLKYPVRALNFAANLGSAFAPRNGKAASPSLSEVINFYHTVKRLYLGKFGKFVT